MDENVDKRLKTIRALIAKAESTVSEAEANSLMAKAQAFMLKYAIDEAVLDAARPQRSKPVIREIEFNDEIHGWGSRRRLLIAIAEMNRVMAKGMRRGQKLTHFNLYGFESDVNYVELLYTSLSVQMENAYLRSDHSEKVINQTGIVFGHAVEMTSGGRLNPANLKNWKSEFMAGYVERIIEILRPASVQGNVETSLVLHDRKEVVRSFYLDYAKANGITSVVPRSEITFHNELARLAGGNSANNADFGLGSNNVSGGGRKQLS